MPGARSTARARPDLRRLRAPGRDHRGGPRAARLQRERDGAPGGGRLGDRPRGRARRPRRRACSGCSRASPTRRTRCARCAWRAWPPSWASRPTRPPSSSRATPPRAWRGLGGAGVRRAQAPGRRRPARWPASSWPTASGSCAWCCRSCHDLHDVEQSGYHHLDVYGHTVEVLARQIELEGRLDELFGELAPRLRGRARRAAGRRPHPRSGHPPGSPAPRRGQAGHPRRAPRRARDLHRTRRAGRAHGARPLPAPAHERAPQPLPRGAHPHAPGARLPRARAAARPGGGVPLPHRHEPRGGGGDAAVVRRSPGHPRPQGRRGDRRPPGARPRADGRRARLAGRRAARAARCAGTSWPASWASRRGPSWGGSCGGSRRPPSRARRAIASRRSSSPGPCVQNPDR